MLEEWANQLDNLYTYQKQQKIYAQVIQSEHADKDRLPATVYKISDEIWLLCPPIQTTQPLCKLDFKRLGWFNIIHQISSHAYKLELPACMKYHPVFHLSLLEPTANNPLDREKQPAPSPIMVDTNVEFEVE